MAKLPQLPKPGDMLAGRFRILDLLGSGGFGTVYRALQENVGRDVALKFLTPGVAKDPVNVERFRREAYHVSQLRHPNTITLYDYGQTEEGLIFMVMELLEGSSLADTVQDEGAIEWPRAAHIFIQVLKSLSEAHQRGLVHRDLKPENIYLCELFGEQDYVKVLDFGVAKMTMAEEGDQAEEKLTKAGRIFGTPMYMAPEQACAEPITPATDVYALGLLIFEMLTGLPPVTGRNRMDVIHKQIRDAVPVLTKELEGTPMGVFIRKSTEKKPSDRYHDASQMLEGFIHALRGMNIHPRARGATFPEISVTSIVPDGLEDLSDAHDAHDAHDAPTVSRPSLKVDPNQTQPPPGVYPGEPPSADSTVEANYEISESEPVKPLPPPIPSTSSEKPRALSKPRYELPLIGRDKDLLKLSTIIQENVFANSGHIILLEGENGVGKSRVVHSLKSSLDEHGIQVCIGHCRPRAVPLDGVREAISEYWGVGHAERMQVDTIVRTDLAATGDYETDEIDRLIDFLRPRGDEPDSTEGGALYAQIDRALVGLAQRKHLVLVLEDIQYADSATLGFLEYFAVTLRTQAVPVSIVLTFRPEERSLNPNLEQSLRVVTSNIGAGFTRYVLRRLRGQDLSVLIDNILPLEPRLKERVGWLSQGVPLHAIQIVRYLQNENNLEKRKGKWKLKKGSPREIDLPPDLMDLMRLRIGQATDKHPEQPSLKATLEWLATLGMRTPIELLSLIMGPKSASLDADLSVLRDQAIVRQSLHLNMICVEFDNSLLREAILQDLSERWANRRLHETAAEKKIEFYRSKKLQIPLVEIAEHWRQAGDIDKYRDTIFAAAQRSLNRQDLRGARDQFRELSELLEDRNDFGEFWSQAQLSLAELAWKFGEFGLAEDNFKQAIDKGDNKGPGIGKAYRGLGHLTVMQGRHGEAADWYKKALEWSRKRNDGRGVAKSLVGLSRVHLAGDLREEAKVSEQLVLMIPKLPSGEISGKVHLHMAEVERRRGDLGKRREYLVRARKEFEDANHRAGLSDTLISLGSALMDPNMNAPNRLVEAGQMFTQALELKRALGDRMGVAEAYRNLGQLEIELGDYKAAEEVLRQSLAIHEALGTQLYAAAVHNALGVLALFSKDFEQAQTHMQMALEIFKRLGDQIATSHCLMNLGELAVNSGDIAKAQSMLREARRMKESLGTSWAVYDIRNHLAIVALWLGEFDEAERLLDETLRTVDEKGTGEDRAIARSLMGLLRCFQSRLQLAALELGRARADAEDLCTDKVTFFCQANAAFYAALTESESMFQGLIASLKDEDFFYTLERSVWLKLLRQIATKTAENERSRQSARLLQTTARFWIEFGFTEEGDKLLKQSKKLESEIKGNR